MSKPLRSPFPWFGGKSAVTPLVWERFGDVRNYVEPFAGSIAVVLGRPHWPFESTRIETINDADCFVANFWRSLKNDPEAVAEHADWPVNEADLHARHLWLVNVAREHIEQLRTDPDYFDAKVAGWWVWGCCQWIGSGWCHHPEWQKRPHLGNAGMGIHRPSHQRGDLHEYLGLLSTRLRSVRVCCGDWSRVCGPTPTVKQGLTAVFLDPPYSAKAGRKSDLYVVDSLTVADGAHKWAISMGDDERIRIALCGYEGEHAMPDSWDCVEWKARGGYGSQGGKSCNGRANSAKERIWFSPHCVSARVQEKQEVLF